MRRPISLLFSLFLAVFPALQACEDHRPVGPLRDGPRECSELEHFCRAPAEAYGEPYSTCYEAGKSKVSNACINYYYDCIDQCRMADEAIGTAGQGGESGMAGAGTGLVPSDAGGGGV